MRSSQQDNGIKSSNSTPSKEEVAERVEAIQRAMVEEAIFELSKDDQSARGKLSWLEALRDLGMRAERAIPLLTQMANDHTLENIHRADQAEEIRISAQQALTAINSELKANT